jgi:NitT/TauT family transport system ATP-binding protein
MLVFDTISKDYRSRKRTVPALRDVSLTVAPQAFVTIVGPSGCGKSTLLNLVAGLDHPTSGTILFHGATVRRGDRRIGYVTQQDNLFPWRALRDNIRFPLEVTGQPRREALERVSYWIDKVGLTGFDDAFPHELSGGMRQRANIARTLIYEPELIMMDEPFGPLDAQTRLELQGELLRIWEETKVSVLFITHDLTEAIALSSQVAIMSARPGRITELRDVPLARPRDIARLHDDPAYRQIYDHLWDTLKMVVEEARTSAGAGASA